MAKYTRRGWMKPAMVVFGSQLAYGKQDNNMAKNGSPCSAIREGAVCGIRQNPNACHVRADHQCQPKDGQAMLIGQNCQTRMGPLCELVG